MGQPTDMSSPQPLQPCPLPIQSTTASHPRQKCCAAPRTPGHEARLGATAGCSTRPLQTRCTRSRRHALGRSAAHDKPCGVSGWHPSHSAPAPNPTPHWLLRLQSDPSLYANGAWSALHQHAGNLKVAAELYSTKRLAYTSFLSEHAHDMHSPRTHTPAQSPPQMRTFTYAGRYLPLL